MNLKLQKVQEDELEHVHHLQILAFKPLLQKYQDFETNPGAEPLAKIKSRFAQSFTKYYFIQFNSKNIGVIRIILDDSENSIRISPMFIHPDYQNLHLGHQAMLRLEELHQNINKWSLDTILQENKLCHFYEKLGYCDTGRREKIKDGMDIIFYEKLKIPSSL